MGNKQSSTATTTISNQTIRDYLNDVNRAIRTDIVAKAINNCEVMGSSNQEVKLKIGPNSKIGDVNISNQAQVRMECVANNVSSTDIQSMLYDKLITTLNSINDTKFQNELEQKAKSSFLSTTFNKNVASTNTSISSVVKESVKNYISNAVANSMLDEKRNKCLLDVSANQSGEYEVVDAELDKLYISNGLNQFTNCLFDNQTLFQYMSNLTGDLTLTGDTKNIIDYKNKTLQSGETTGLFDGLTSLLGGLANLIKSWLGALMGPLMIVGAVILVIIILSILGGMGGGRGRNTGKD
jgi:hypothetical protein